MALRASPRVAFRNPLVHSLAGLAVLLVFLGLANGEKAFTTQVTHC